MQWTGHGLIIGVRRHGEASVIVEAMVEGRGRHLGLVRGGRSHKQAATLQPGNTVQLVWRARLEDHLGTFTVELVDGRGASLIASKLMLYALQVLCEHLRLLPERDPHDAVLARAMAIIDGAREPAAVGAALARFELMLLEELGFGLDLASCAATGAASDLTHVSPKSGRAVSRAAAEPYRDRLLRLPAFLKNGDMPTAEDLRDAFRLTGYFLDQHVWTVRPIDPPASRDGLIGLVTAYPSPREPMGSLPIPSHLRGKG